MRRGRDLRRQADNPLPGDPAMTSAVHNARRALEGQSADAGGEYLQDRGGMASALAGLQGLANGTGPSLAQEQLRNQSQANIAATMAAMGSARGGNLNAAQMGAATAGVGMAQQTNQTMAELRAREQIDALNSAGGLASTMAGMSSGRELQYAGMGNDTLMQQYAMANQRELARAGMINDRLDTRNRNRRGWADYGMNAAGQVAGGAATFSDVRVKVAIRDKPSIARALAALGEPGEREDDDDDDEDDDDGLGVLRRLFTSEEASEAAAELGRVKPYTYRYDDRAKAMGSPDGDVVGVMAQDLEAAGPRGREAVYDHPSGPKALHPAKSIGLALAASADHEDRLRKLERRVGRAG